MKEILDRIDSLSSIAEHYLVISKNENNLYFQEFLETVKVLKNVMSDKEFEFWCSEKMLLKKQPFLEKTYIQNAVETSAVRYFAEYNNEDFAIEAKINPNNRKDVDCKFKNNGFTYNIEVKCSNFEEKELSQSGEGFKVGTAGRIPERKEIQEELRTLFNNYYEKKGEHPKALTEIKNMDNNLKDFLKLSNEKFDPNPKENEINILLVGCNDAIDMDSWCNCLFQNEGFFTKAPYFARENYSNVDLVIFTNLYFKHNKHYNKKIKNSWTLKNSFNLVFSSPYRKLDKKNGIENFLSFFPHYTYQLYEYKVPGNVPKDISDIFKCSYFIKDELEKKKGVYLFEED